MVAVKGSRIFIYGPPGSGKTTVGKDLAHSLGLNFIDLDQKITEQAGMSIPDIFKSSGENGFRKLETQALKRIMAEEYEIIALGGGALLDEKNLELVQSKGVVICLTAPLDELQRRLDKDKNKRPLVEGELGSNLAELIAKRADHYLLFQNRIDTFEKEGNKISEQARILSGQHRVTGGGADYLVKVIPGGLHSVGQEIIAHHLRGPFCLVTDENVADFYAEPVISSLKGIGHDIEKIVIQPGEKYKTVKTVEQLWDRFLEAGLERGSTVIALGGGVVGDLAGFAAATYKRGINWVVLPTSLLAMVDASLGGKTGADLPRGKNLVGSFHHPSFVLVDPETLDTLPDVELRSGMAEAVKHGVIGSIELYNRCQKGWEEIEKDWRRFISQAISVKVSIINRDPYENGERAILNLGHTFGHALETASNYQVKHGEAVSIGMVAAARYSEKMGIAEPGLAMSIKSTLDGLGLPTDIPGNLARNRIIEAMKVDKKRSGGKTKVVLPVQIGEVGWNFEIDEEALIGS